MRFALPFVVFAVSTLAADRTPPSSVVATSMDLKKGFELDLATGIMSHEFSFNEVGESTSNLYTNGSVLMFTSYGVIDRNFRTVDLPTGNVTAKVPISLDLGTIAQLHCDASLGCFCLIMDPDSVHFVKMDAATGNVTVLNKLVAYDGYVSDASALDASRGLFHVVLDSKLDGSTLVTLDCTDGTIKAHVPMDRSVSRAVHRYN